MGSSSLAISVSSTLSNNKKVLALESSLQQSMVNFQDLILGMEQLHIESENHKAEFLKQKEKCVNKTCNGAETLKKIIETKDHVIQSVASALIKLNETKNFNILEEAFKIIFGDTCPLPSLKVIKSEPNITLISPKKEQHSPAEDVSFKDDSVSEIEGTPTGRTSPIIQSKKFKSSAVVTPSDFRDKKKCPDSWPAPENKALKLIFSTPASGRGRPSGRLRQGRLNLVKMKTTNVVDLTCSPEFSGACSQNGRESRVQTLVKKESCDNDDTVLPSPTSVPTGYNLFKSSKENPIKFKKPSLLSLKTKCEKNIKSESKLEICDVDNKCMDRLNDNKNDENAEDSINILNPNRLPINQNRTPEKQAHCNNETTFYETQASISLLQHVNKLDEINRELKQNSPSKQPLAENINVTNTTAKEVLEASMSLLPREPKTNAPVATTNFRKKIPEFVEVAYKEAAPRKKAEKRMLPGWSCDECRDFFGELYKDDPVMLARKIDECSRHRGRHDPARPRTPPGYWLPRWDLPADTEQFNRRNNVA